MSNVLENTYVDDLEQIKRLRNAKTVQPLSINHDTCEGIFKGSSKECYSTTLNSCTCRDFIVRNQPCKHIYKLALELGVIDFQDNIDISIKSSTTATQTQKKEITYKKKLKANTSSFIVVDLETTGVSYKVDKIIEVGAIKVINGKIVDTFVSLINPGIPIPANATRINHITNTMVCNQPTFKDILPSFITFIEDLPLVAHNAPFDAKFLVAEFANFNTELPNQFIDTLSISRKLFPDSPNHKLTTLKTYLNLKGDASHRALDDAYVTYLLYMKCFEIETNTTINNLSPLPSQISTTINIAATIENSNNSSSTADVITQSDNYSRTIDNKSDKNRTVAIVLCLMFGAIGMHRFYVGKNVSAIIFILTCGVFGLGIIFDLILLLKNQFKDKNGKYLI